MLIPTGSAMLFFNSEDDVTMLAFATAQDIVSVLDEVIHFEIYVTNERVDSFVSINHHDVLAASGAVKDRLAEYLRGQSSTSQ